MPPAQQDSTTISTKQMREAIKQSGYLLEQRVEPIIRNAFGYVETNPIYKDPDTDKSCELDIYALSASRVYKNDMSFIFPILLCECENNSQPVVFFIGDTFLPFFGKHDLKLSGIPIKFWNDKVTEYMSLADVVDLESSHHFCVGQVATQYCTFQMKKDKSNWIALHNDDQHETFNKLIKAVNYEVTKHSENWLLPDKAEEEPVNIQIYYPLVILQGDLFSACLKNNRLILRESNHIQFRKQFIRPEKNEAETYQIDVIVESFLPDYLKIIEAEIDKIMKSLQHQKAKIRLSIEKIIEEAKKLKENQKSYRELFEF